MLERFTRRAPKDWAPNPTKKGGNAYVKLIANPRKVDFICDPHVINYFEGYHSVNENGTPVWAHLNFPITAEKIVLNHYHTKSREEHFIRKSRTQADLYVLDDVKTSFNEKDRNEVFDDGILKYRDERARNFRLPDKSHADERLLAALMENLLPTLVPNTPEDFYAGKMETFLTCRAVAEYLKMRLTNDNLAKFLEEASLKAIIKSINGMTFADARLLIRELPNLLALSYPVVNELCVESLNVISNMMNTLSMSKDLEGYNRHKRFKDFVELEHLQRLLKLF